MVSEKEFKELKEIIKAGAIVSNSVAASFENGKLDWHDARHFVPDVPHVMRAIEDGEIGLRVFPHISREQKLELQELVVETVKFDETPTEQQVEQIIIESMNFVLSGYRLYRAIKPKKISA